MNKPEKKSLIIGGSILGGLALGFAGYKLYKSKQTKKGAPINPEDDSNSDNGDYDEQRNKARGIPSSNTKKPDNLSTDSDKSVSDMSLTDMSLTESEHGGKKKKIRRKQSSRSRQKKKKSKNNRKRHSKKRKKSKK